MKPKEDEGTKKPKEDEGTKNETKKEVLFTWDFGGNASRIMEKMNYEEGKGLGVKGCGIKEPIKIHRRPKCMGMGFSGSERREKPSNEEGEKYNAWKYIQKLKDDEENLVRGFKDEVEALSNKRLDDLASEEKNDVDEVEALSNKRLDDLASEEKNDVDELAAQSHKLPPPAPTISSSCVPTSKRKPPLPFEVFIKPRNFISRDEEKKLSAAVECDHEDKSKLRSVSFFDKLKTIHKGTKSTVFKAIDKEAKHLVALKKVNTKEEGEYGFPLTTLREINLHWSFHHPSIVKVNEIVVGGKDDRDLYLVLQHLEHDLLSVMERKEHPFSISETKQLMLQLLDGVKYLHTNWVIHRDLKPSHLLMNNEGQLKICDYSMARKYSRPIKAYTQKVVTQWYRPPELLLGAKKYSTAVDIWSIGCIMAELLSLKPLFQGKSELTQLEKIFEVLGTPSEAKWPGWSSLPNAKVKFFPRQPYKLHQKFHLLTERGNDLLNGLLTLDPEKRLTVEEALNHGWFKEIPLPKSQDFMPTFPPRGAR